MPVNRIATVAGVLWACLIVATAAAEQPESEIVRSFQKQCAACHTIPDPSIRTDRAWLEQIRDTA